MELITIRNPGDLAPTIDGMGMQVPVESLSDVSDGYHTINSTTTGSRCLLRCAVF